VTARVLIVDDIPTNVRLLEARLTAEYYEVVTASSGPQALEICNNSDVDIILLDVMMPDMDGFEVCRRIKEDTRLKEVPVIFLTAKGGGEALAEGFESGAVMYINKPFTANKLLTIVNTMLESGENLA
jgi:two-component system cell cycle response regulator